MNHIIAMRSFITLRVGTEPVRNSYKVIVYWKELGLQYAFIALWFTCSIFLLSARGWLKSFFVRIVYALNMYVSCSLIIPMDGLILIFLFLSLTLFHSLFLSAINSLIYYVWTFLKMFKLLSNLNLYVWNHCQTWIC